jgi:hypothetical protein
MLGIIDFNHEFPRTNLPWVVDSAFWIPACAGMTVQRFLPDRFWQTLFSKSRVRHSRAGGNPATEVNSNPLFTLNRLN